MNWSLLFFVLFIASATAGVVAFTILAARLGRVERARHEIELE